MRVNVTVKEAISRGLWTITIPGFLILLGLFVSSLILYHLKYFEGWILAVGAVSGFVFGWLYWSYAITKWRIWAFENVRNVHELKRKAIENNLIWKDGSWAEKTEIRNYEDQKKLKQLEKKFLEKDVYHDDVNIPKETLIDYSKGMLAFGFIFGLAAFGFGIYLYLRDAEAIALLLCCGLGLYFLFVSTRRVMNKEPQIILNSQGIKLAKSDFMDWQFITNDCVVKRKSGKYVHCFLSFDFHGEHQEIKIDEFNTNQEKLENCLHVYRVRYEKNNPS